MEQNRLTQLFARQQRDLLAIYFTAGYPQLHDTRTVLKALADSGADIVEVGMPYSDPVADGPTIQASNQQALENGMTVEVLFEQLDGIRSEVDLPVVLMGYFNPVLQYGVEAFCRRCSEVGIDALILPDLPVAEYTEHYKALFEKYGLFNIFLISPQTSEARIRQMDDATHGFIYMVSSASITGAKKEITPAQLAYFDRVSGMGLRHPRLIGFGIGNHQSFAQACQHASGAIIGSAFINALNDSADLPKDISTFVKSIKGT